MHGLFGSSDNWHGIALTLAERFQVFTVDLRNHGQSPHSAEMNFAVMADDVSEFLTSHNLADVVLMGHSLGGKVAMQFALSHPERLRALIVVDIAPRAYGPAHATILEAMLALDLSGFESRSEIESALANSIPAVATRRFLLKNVASAADGSFRWKLNPPGIHANYQHLNESVADDSTRPFRKPALFIRGGRSNYVTDEDWSAIQNVFPTAKLETIADAGHWTHADAPERFVGCVREFLE